MALACDFSDIYVTLNHGVRREKNEKAQSESEILVGEVEKRKNTFGLFGGHSSGITNK